MAKNKELEVLTQYEKARVIGARALQLAMDAPPLIKVPQGLLSAVTLSFLEYEKSAIPLRVVRTNEN